MVIVRRFVTQQRLQKPMNIGGAEEILAARHKRDMLEVIVHGDAEMIAGRHILAGQHHIAQVLRSDAQIRCSLALLCSDGLLLELAEWESSLY